MTIFTEFLQKDGSKRPFTRKERLALFEEKFGKRQISRRAKMWGLHPSQLSSVLHGTLYNRRIQRMVAKRLGKRMAELFPPRG